MKITFYGATREVTGSCYLLATERTRILIDCGMFQGGAMCDAKNYQALGFDASSLDAVFVTHAHLDHTGRLPKLMKEGYRGKIYATPPTAELASLVLEDAYQVMLDDFSRDYRPMPYEEQHIKLVEKAFKTVGYGKRVSVGDITVTLHDAGHIFGSAFIECVAKDGKRAIFSGDLGNKHMPILRPTEPLPETDALIIESTYGNRIHEDESMRENTLREAILKTVKTKSVLIIPAFAIERTQQVLYEMNDLVAKHKLPNVDIYLDSPLAIKATEVFESYPNYYSKEALRVVSSGDDLFNFPGLHATPAREDSKRINDAPMPKVIIAGAGMMNGGRILHHLVRYLGDPNATVLIIGYQAHGTLGRHLYEGDKVVNVLQERVHVKATIKPIGAYSAHADQAELLGWVREAKQKPKKIFCTHGEEGASAALATLLQQKIGVPADVPRLGETIVV